MKPIRIEAVEGGFNLYVNGAAIVQHDNGVNVDFDRVAAGCKVPRKYKAPKSATPATLDQEKAKALAHHAGRYILGMGDFVSAYTQAPAGFWD